MATKTQSIFRDLDLSFTINPLSGDVPVLKDINAVVFGMKSCLFTNNYEKPFNPEFGGGIRQFLFEQVDDITSAILQKNIAQTLENYEPRITVQNIVVQANPYEDRYDVTIQFFMSNNPAAITVNFFLERIR